jgi:hypothetical protein
MNVVSDVWQVQIQGQVYDTDIETLKKWVGEGLIAPTDRVKKGSLAWLEAGRAPALRRAFAGEEVSSAASPTVADHAPTHQNFVSDETTNRVHDAQTDASFAPPQGAKCHFHPDVESKFVCRVCGATFCKQCPNFVGGSNVALCKLCGDLCKPVEEVRQKVAHAQFQSSGFGFADFATALRYPFQNIISLIFGAALYGLLLVGGFRGRILASALVFGCLSIVINKVAYGKLDRNFLPDFSSFNLWDDVAAPIFLGLGVAAVTIGPTILLAAVLLFGLFGGATPSEHAAAQMKAEQEQTQLTDEDMAVLVDGDDPEREAEVAKKIESLRPANQIAEQAKASEESQSFPSQMLAYLTGSPALVVLLFVLTLGWALLYYPMALSVAGFTEDFWSVVNPLVGLDIIRRMGLTYAKAFAMYACVQLGGLVLSVGVGIVLAPFNMPFIGNLPATFIDGMLTFYASLVVACILGLALFKTADRLGIYAE